MRGRAKKGFGGTILIADDHPLVRAGLAQLLRRCMSPRKIVEAKRFEDVIAHLEASDVALAIVDLGMPGLNRAADLRRIREVSPGTRAVVLSGSTSRADILEALKAGMHGYIVKSQASDELIAKLRHVLSGEVYVPPSLADLTPEATPAETHHPTFKSQPQLTDRQRQVLTCVVDGKANKEIAQELDIAEGTVKMHLASLFRALGATNRAHAVALGRRHLK